MMENFWKWSTDHYVLTFFMFVLILFIIRDVIIILPNRMIRHLNIRKHGWPPSHCDADGDTIKKDN